MVQLTPHDSSALSRLVRFDRLPADKRQEIFDELQAEDARKVGEVVLDPQKYSSAPEPVRATVDRFQQWSEANRRLGKQRALRRQKARAR